MDGSCPSDLFFLKIDGACEDGPRAIGEGISRPFPPGDEQVTVQNHFPVSRQYYKTSDYLSKSAPSKNISPNFCGKNIPLFGNFGQVIEFCVAKFTSHGSVGRCSKGVMYTVPVDQVDLITDVTVSCKVGTSEFRSCHFLRSVP